MRNSYDSLAERCLDELLEIDVEGGDVYTMMQKVAEGATHGPVYEFWKEIHTVPVWVNKDQIKRGQDVFYRYGGPALTGLCYQSLLGGLAAQRITETLARTGGFKTEKARKRLLETTQHILQVTQNVESLLPGGKGHLSTIRVRLLHALVRRKIMDLARKYPDYYDVETLGVPINDCDSIATICTFSASLIWNSLPSFGIFLREEEIVDFIAVWRLVAFYIGAPTEPFEDPWKAKAYMESIFAAEISPGSSSRILADNVIKSLANKPPSYSSYDFLTAQARWLNGKKLSDNMHLKQASSYSCLLVFAQCIFFVLMCYTYRSVSFLDRRKVRLVKALFYRVIVEGKLGLREESTFAFQYVPEYGFMTDQGKFTPEMHVRHLGNERRNLKILVALGLFMSMAVWAIYRIWGPNR